jgi:hypothetical protein
VRRHSPNSASASNAPIAEYPMSQLMYQGVMTAPFRACSVPRGRCNESRWLATPRPGNSRWWWW